MCFLQAMNIESQDSIFGQENSVRTAQNSSQPQLPEPENKIDDSIDNQQQVFVETCFTLHVLFMQRCCCWIYFSWNLTLTICRIWTWMRVLMEWRRRSLNQRRRKQQAHGLEHVLGHARGLFILFLFLTLHESVFVSSHFFKKYKVPLFVK